MSVDRFCSAVDDVIGWPPFQAPAAGDVRYRQSARTVLDGLWVGAYVQPHERFASGWMTVRFRQTGEILEGEGCDPNGPFTMRGRIEDAAGHVDLVKRYVGAHAVAYAGVVGDGAMHGCWTIERTTHSGVWALRAARCFEADTVEALEERAIGISLVDTFGVDIAPSAPEGWVDSLVRDFQRLR